MQIEARRRHLLDAISQTERLDRLAVWAARYGNALCCHVWAANAFFSQSGFPAEVVQGRILQHADSIDFTEAELQGRRRRRWQGSLRDVLRPAADEHAFRFFRRRLERCGIRALPGNRVQRALNMFKKLIGKVSAWVLAALLRTLCNGWCVARRFQRTASGVFGRGGLDSIEHYARCQAVDLFARTRLALPQHEDPLAEFLMISGTGGTEDDVLIRRAARTAAAHKLHCTFRHSNEAAVASPDALTQVAREIVRSHPRAARVVGHSVMC